MKYLLRSPRSSEIDKHNLASFPPRPTTQHCGAEVGDLDEEAVLTKNNFFFFSGRKQQT